MLKKEKMISSKNIYSGKILDVYVDKVLTPDNKETTRELIRHCKASCILAIDENNNVIIEKQYRYPYDDFLIELPAGKCDKDEDPKQTAIRELKEETGYVANKVEYLGKIYPSCAYTDEIIYCYLATNLKKDKAKLDEGEFLDVEIISLEKLLELVNQDKINDAKTLTTILFYLNKYKLKKLLNFND